MFTEHPSPAELLAIARGEPGHDSARMHVEGGCASCTAKLRQAAGVEIRRLEDLAYDVVFEENEVVRDGYYDALAPRLGAWKSVGKGETVSAQELEAQLLAVPIADRRDRIRRSRRFASFGLVEHLVERARDEGFREPARAVELANLALEVAEVLEEAGIPERIAADAQALAWAMLANAHRIQAELIEAERAMAAAKRLLAGGTGHAWVRGEILSLEGSLRTDEARFGEAVAVLTEASAIYRVLGDLERQGKIVMQLGNAAGEAGETETAIRLLERSVALLREGGAVRLALRAQQALGEWLRRDGQTQKARAAYNRTRDEYLRVIEDPVSRLRLAWHGALISADEGETEGAVRELARIRREFEDLESVYDVCLVALDIVAVSLSAGRLNGVRTVARELAMVFSSRQIHHQALEALALFQQAIERERVSVELVEQLKQYLRRSYNNPYLKFEVEYISS